MCLGRHMESSIDLKGYTTNTLMKQEKGIMLYVWPPLEVIISRSSCHSSFAADLP